MNHEHLITGYRVARQGRPFHPAYNIPDEAYAIGFGAGLIDLNLGALGQPELAGLELLKRRFDLTDGTIRALLGEE